MAEEKKVKKKIKIRKYGLTRIIIILLFLYLFANLCIYLFNLPIKNIYINGTSLLTDHEIIISGGIKDYPSIFRTSSRSIKKKLMRNSLIKDVKINKWFNGKITITIVENKPIFYNKNIEKIVLENKEAITDNGDFLKIPTLINYVPDKIYNLLVKNIEKIDYDIIGLISEIEYAPTEINENSSDRFLLRMNDENIVFINLINIKNLNLYPGLASSLDTEEKGTFYLDSSNSENIIFIAF